MSVNNPLGNKTVYKNHYDASLLFPIPRQNRAKSEVFLPKSRHKFTCETDLTVDHHGEKPGKSERASFYYRCYSLFFAFLERSLLSRLCLNRRLRRPHLSDAFV